jgi:hypothetical protein
VREWLRWPIHGEQEAAAELVLASAVGDDGRARGNEIGGAWEHQ